MIAGETQLLFSEYPGPEDHLLGLKSKKNMTRPEPPAPAKTGRGREVIKKVGNAVNSMGGFEGIGRRVDQIGGLIARRDSDTGNAPEATPARETDLGRLQEEAEKREAEQKKKKNQVLIWRIVGFAALAALLGLAAYSISKSDPQPAVA